MSVPAWASNGPAPALLHFAPENGLPMAFGGMAPFPNHIPLGNLGEIPPACDLLRGATKPAPPQIPHGTKPDNESGYENMRSRTTPQRRPPHPPHHQPHHWSRIPNSPLALCLLGDSRRSTMPHRVHPIPQSTASPQTRRCAGSQDDKRTTECESPLSLPQILACTLPTNGQTRKSKQKRIATSSIHGYRGMANHGNA
jgi:hypothetical protein